MKPIFKSEPSSCSTATQLLAAIALSVVFLSASALPAGAGSSRGYGETEFSFSNKADCCEEAVYRAQDNSAANCERSGGYPDFRSSSARGRCDWKTRRGRDGRSVYGCTATATVYCR